MAQSPSPTATASAQPSASPDLAETTQRLRDRIGKIVEERRDQVAGVLDEVTNRRRGFIGEIQRVSSETLTIRSNRGTQILPLSGSVTMTRAGRAISVDDIVVGEWAVVIGRTVDDQFQLERLMLSSTSLRPRAQTVVLGELSGLTRTTATVEPRSGEAATQFNLVTSTTYQDIEGNTIRLAELEEEMQVLAVGVNTDRGVEARVIRALIPLANGN